MNAVTSFARDPDQPDRRCDRLLGIAEVISRTSLSKPTIYRRVAAGTFPPSRSLGGRRVGWYESDIATFVAAPALYGAS